MFIGMKRSLHIYCLCFVIRAYHFATPVHRQKVDNLIRQLKTAKSYGCNYKTDGLDILSISSCSSMNEMSNFDCAVIVMIIVIMHHYDVSFLI